MINNSWAKIASDKVNVSVVIILYLPDICWILAKISQLITADTFNDCVISCSWYFNSPKLPELSFCNQYPTVLSRPAFRSPGCLWTLPNKMESSGDTTSSFDVKKHKVWTSALSQTNMKESFRLEKDQRWCRTLKEAQCLWIRLWQSIQFLVTLWWIVLTLWWSRRVPMQAVGSVACRCWPRLWKSVSDHRCA